MVLEDAVRDAAVPVDRLPADDGVMRLLWLLDCLLPLLLPLARSVELMELWSNVGARAGLETR